MSDLLTEPMPTVTSEVGPPHTIPREMSQTAIVAFFYGTLQLLFTSILAGLILIGVQLSKSLQQLTSPDIAGIDKGSVPGADADQLVQIVEELGVIDPSLATAPLPVPDTIPAIGDTSTLPFLPVASPQEIVPLELLAVVFLNGFGFAGLIVMIVAFRATSRAKNGRGLVWVAFASILLSLGISLSVAFLV